MSDLMPSAVICAGTEPARPAAWRMLRREEL